MDNPRVIHKKKLFIWAFNGLFTISFLLKTKKGSPTTGGDVASIPNAKNLHY
jgi:hypothetical protein